MINLDSITTENNKEHNEKRPYIPENIYENINDYNPIRKRKKLFVFDDMIANIMPNKYFQAIIK